MTHHLAVSLVAILRWWWSY